MPTNVCSCFVDFRNLSNSLLEDISKPLKQLVEAQHKARRPVSITTLPPPPPPPPPPCGDFCRLLITFANSLEPDQDRQNVGPDLDSKR